MMVQPAPEGQPRFVTYMREHNAMCQQLVEAFGNEQFERFEPFELVAYAISHHDYGWDEVDANPEVNPENGFPVGLGNGSVPGIIDTGTGSASYNEAYHLYSGLISSMHITGLYSSRYDLSDFSVRIGGSKSIPVKDEDKPALDRMMTRELARQETIKAELRKDPAYAPWLDDRRIWSNYKVMQFIDTLSLYFHTRHRDDRKPEVFVHVPLNENEDASVTLTPLGGDVYSLDPFPFAGDEFVATCQGRYVSPISPNSTREEMKRVLAETPISTQTHTFVRA